MQITIIDGGYRSYSFEHEFFASHGYELIIGKEAPNAVGILVRDTPVGLAELDQMPHLKAIVRYGVGYDNIDIQEAKKRGVRLCHANHPQQGFREHDWLAGGERCR